MLLINFSVCCLSSPHWFVVSLCLGSPDRRSGNSFRRRDEADRGHRASGSRRGAVQQPEASQPGLCEQLSRKYGEPKRKLFGLQTFSRGFKSGCFDLESNYQGLIRMGNGATNWASLRDFVTLAINDYQNDYEGNGPVNCFTGPFQMRSLV